MADSGGRGPIIGGLVVVVILLVAVAGYFAYQSSQGGADIEIDVPGVNID